MKDYMLSKDIETCGDCSEKITCEKLGKVICVETGEIFESLAAAGRAMKINSHNIGNVIRGKNNTAGGYHWRRYEEDIQENVKQEEQRVKSLELIEWAKDKDK